MLRNCGGAPWALKRILPPQPAAAPMQGPSPQLLEEGQAVTGGDGDGGDDGDANGATPRGEDTPPDRHSPGGTPDAADDEGMADSSESTPAGSTTEMAEEQPVPDSPSR
eukprot:2193058-Alexandrium_andersonii.AAC.1